MKAEIKGVYSHDREGIEYVTKTGTFYWKVLIKTEEDVSIYETFFLTQKAYWKVESLFKSVGKPCPGFNDVAFSDVEALVGETINISAGKNERGYESVLKWFPALPKPGADVVDTDVTDEVSGQIADDDDPDLDEDVPF